MEIEAASLGIEVQATDEEPVVDREVGEEEAAEATETAPKPKKRRSFAGLYPSEGSKLGGGDTKFQDALKNHPEIGEINRLIMSREMSSANICRKYGLSGNWVITRQRKRLVKMAAKAVERRKHAADLQRGRRQENRALALMELPLQQATDGFNRLMAAAVEPKDIQRGATFIEQYLAAVQKYGELTGELGTAGQTNVNWQQNSLHIMSLPRTQDTPEQLAIAAKMGLPQPAQIVDVQAAARFDQELDDPYDEDEDDPDDSDGPVDDDDSGDDDDEA